MKIVIAPQSFKGSLSAEGVAQAMSRGVVAVVPEADLDMAPLADGGEGTVRALVAATGGRTMETRVTGPLGEGVTALWGVLGDGKTGVIEMAAASGLPLVPEERLDPLAATTYGTGELIRAALDADGSGRSGCSGLIIGIGGSATNDGGAGMGQALGVRFLDETGRELPPGGAALARLAAIDVSGLDGRLHAVGTTVACDVTNPLCGENGASHVYGPQKGATAAMCRQLDAALAHYADVLHRTLGRDVRDIPGAGAAGGLGAGLMAFLDAELVPGVDVVCEAVGLEERLRGADLVLTGEGRLDAQTSFGKTVSGVAIRAKAAGVPVIALAGEVAGDLSPLYRNGLTAALSITAGPVTRARAMRDAAPLISRAAEAAVRTFLAGAGRSPSAN